MSANAFLPGLQTFISRQLKIFAKYLHFQWKILGNWYGRASLFRGIIRPDLRGRGSLLLRKTLRCEAQA